MRHPADHYRVQLQALLPQGAAWPREDGTLLRLLSALAEEFARIDGRATDLVDEADPRATIELLPEWERAFGLPDPCIDTPDTIAERQAALHEKVARIGGQNAAYYIGVAARLGYTITITEFRPHHVARPVNYPLYGTDWWFVWQVNAPEETVTPFRVTSGVNEPLADWGNEILECAISRLAPAHTYVIFSYGG